MSDNGRMVGEGWGEGIAQEVRDQGNKIAAMERTVQQLDHVVNGNGQPGLSVQMAKVAGAVAFLAWFVPIAVTILLAWIGSLEYRHAVSDAVPVTVVAQPAQDSKIPPLGFQGR